jgi:hypothetical protein
MIVTVAIVIVAVMIVIVIVICAGSACGRDVRDDS